VSLDQATVTLVQWLVSQGIGVAVAVAVLWLVGRKIDQQSTTLTDLRAAIAQLTQAITDRLAK
jgi:outer membrane murein-binding lipoprotein Lpp